MLILIRIAVFLLALFLLWRIAREYYFTLRERFGRKSSVEEVVEPVVEDLRREGKKVLRIYLPGVDSERKIQLKVLRESIEIRADGKRNSFFKIIPVGSKSRVRSKRFQPPVLEIEIE